MSSPASIGKHPIHPMLVVFPLGLLNFSCAADLIGKNGKNEKIWKEVAARTMAGGVIGALGAAVPRADRLSLPEREGSEDRGRPHGPQFGDRGALRV